MSLPLPIVRFVPVRYPLLLGTFTVLFILRVLGQVLVGIHEVDFLPPFEQWYSGVVPYWLLLPLQIALIALMVRIVRDFVRGDGYFIDLKPRTGAALKMLSCIYFLSMLVRYIVTMAWHPELRWFTRTIPIWFHMDLAAFIFMLGDYQTRRPSAAAQRPTP